MSAKKVKKYIRQQRRQQNRADKQQRAAAQAQAATPQPQASSPSAQPRSGAESSPQPRPRHSPAIPRRPHSRGPGAKIWAVVAGLGITAAAIGSAAVDILDGEPQSPSAIPVQAVPAPVVTEQLVCPPMPGQPDSLTERGVLDYAQRDDSAQSWVTGQIFTSAAGSLPEATLAELTPEGLDEQRSLSQDDPPQDQGPDVALQDRNITTFSETDTAEATLLTLTPDEPDPAHAPAGYAGFSYHADSGPAAGFASTQCSTAQRSQWFLGPETGSGANSLLSVANPHDREATVEVTSYDAEGETGSLGATTLLIPENSVRTVNLAAFTEEEQAQLAVHVQASGAPVTAHLQSGLAEGSTGLGMELLPTQLQPRQQHHMPAVPAGDPAENPQLWLHVPGEEQATIELQVFGSEGQVEIDTPGVFTAEPERVSVVDLQGLEPGTYDVVVTADQPTLSAMRSPGDGEPVTVEVELDPQIDPLTGLELEPETQEQDADPEPDFSWSVATDPLTPGYGAILPETGDVELRLFAPADEESVEVTYRLYDSEGTGTQDLTAEVSGGSSSTVTQQELQEQADAEDLEDLTALMVVAAEGEVYGASLARDQEGRFTIGQLVQVAPQDRYVPLHLMP